MLYELFKKAYLLPRENKEYLLDSWDNIIAILKEAKKTKTVKKKTTMQPMEIDTKQDPDSWYEPYRERSRQEGPFISQTGQNEILRTIQASKKLYDPETKEQMLRVIELLEKFIDIDEDISYDNLALFIHPLTRGSTRVMLRPYRVVGLARKLEFLAKHFARQLAKGIENDEMKTQFMDNLQIIRKRLSAPDQDAIQQEKAMMQEETLLDTEQPGFGSDNQKESPDLAMLIQNITRLKSFGWSPEQILSFFDNSQSILANPEDVKQALSQVFSTNSGGPPITP